MGFFFETILGEAIFELFFSGCEKAVKSNRLLKPIRYLIGAIGLLLFLALIGLMVFTGVSIIIETSLIGGMIILAVAILIVISAIRKICKAR